MDSEAFRQEPGYHVFQFHAAIEEYLPEGLRGRIPGIHRDDLPDGCQYYAGGHIHLAYVGEGPHGGLLVNPGTLFGTSRTDLGYHAHDTNRHGLALVEVRDGRSKLEFYDPYPEERVDQVEIDVTARPAEEVRAELDREAVRLDAGHHPVLFHLTGVPTSGTLAEYGIGSIARRTGVDTSRIAVDLDDLDLGAGISAPTTTEAEVESEEFDRLQKEASPDLTWLEGPAGGQRLRQLLAELGTPRLEGEAMADYREARRRGALRLLEVRRVENP